ncbi:hypothetical protein ACODNH_17995 [Haloarcula sp. NS06]|uniref:hypothetical protein n=1 Tax=Haloarcula sp. NS06 TaxID=3409688 RepID=UPI003DA71182
MSDNSVDTDGGISNNICNPASLSGDNVDSNIIISRFVIEEYVVKRYEDAMDWAEKIGNKPTILIMFGYIVGIGTLAVLTALNIFSESTRELLFSATFGISVGIGIILWVLKRIFLKYANKQDMLEPEAAIYHRFARAIQEYMNNNFENSMNEIKSAGKMMNYEEQKPFPPRVSKELFEYTETVSERDSVDFFKSSFPSIANKLITLMTTVYIFEHEDLYKEDISMLEQAQETSPRDMILSYLRALTQNRVVRIVLPYVIAAPILFLVYQENKQAAQILAVIVVAVVQTYYKPTESD